MSISEPYFLLCKMGRLTETDTEARRKLLPANNSTGTHTLYVSKDSRLSTGLYFMKHNENLTHSPRARLALGRQSTQLLYCTVFCYME